MMVILDTLMVGNVKPSYIIPPLRAEYRQLYFDASADPSEWFVKGYNLRKPTDRLPQPAQIQKLLLDQFRNDEVELGLGLGFVIVSEGVVNLSMWREDYPHLPMQTLWKPNGEKGFSRIDRNKENSYCIFEMEIASHEANAWRRFLESSRMISDRTKYINDIFIPGK